MGRQIRELHFSEIISLDSMAVYRGMDVGTAKPTAEDRRRTPHHLLDLVDPTEEFSLSQYVAQVTGAPVIPAFCARMGFRKYLVQVYPEISLPRRATEGELDAGAQAIADAMTSFLRAHPTQWFRFRD